MKLSITEICLITITVILLIRNSIDMIIMLRVSRKWKFFFQQSHEILKDIKAISSLLNDESQYLKKMIHVVTEDAQEKLIIFKQLIDGINQNLVVLNSIVKAVTSSIKHFFKEKE